MCMGCKLSSFSDNEWQRKKCACGCATHTFIRSLHTEAGGKIPNKPISSLRSLKMKEEKEEGKKILKWKNLLAFIFECCYIVFILTALKGNGMKEVFGEALRMLWKLKMNMKKFFLPFLRKKNFFLSK